jgi:hypothetical protein
MSDDRAASRRVTMILRKVAVGVCVLFGGVMVSNMTTPGDLGKDRASRAAVPLLKVNVTGNDQAAKSLRARLEHDEINEKNPFAHLTPSDALNDLFSHPIESFERRVFRRPAYKGTFGYDVVQYDIFYRDGKRASILAKVTEDPTNLSEEKILVSVHREFLAEGVFLVSQYLDDVLMDEREMSLDAVQTLVAQQVRNAVPFMSVAR